MKTVLVTGGGRGIGAGICDALAREGWAPSPDDWFENVWRDYREGRVFGPS